MLNISTAVSLVPLHRAWGTLQGPAAAAVEKKKRCLVLRRAHPPVLDRPGTLCTCLCQTEHVMHNIISATYICTSPKSIQFSNAYHTIAWLHLGIVPTEMTDKDRYVCTRAPRVAPVQEQGCPRPLEGGRGAAMHASGTPSAVQTAPIGRGVFQTLHKTATPCCP